MIFLENNSETNNIQLCSCTEYNDLKFTLFVTGIKETNIFLFEIHGSQVSKVSEIINDF